MRSYRCVCDNTVFFDNSQCVVCNRELGFCPTCQQLVALLPTDDGGAEGTFKCGNPECGTTLKKCFNYSKYNVCNRCVAVDAPADALCDCCRFNETIPDLTVPGNLYKWHRLEKAKRRLFYDLSELGLPYGTAADGIQPPLAFDFKADVIPTGNFWRSSGGFEKVFTGHANGHITINVREADRVEAEKLRVDLGESHRTLIGHFRHEIGHYYWDMLVKGRREDQSRAVFGDHDHPTYAEALDAHYKNGAPADWRENYISAYATMHAWEDFAETWAAYLDMVSGLDTAHHMGFGGETDPVHADLDEMVLRYQRLGVALNEMSRSMGLLDFVPDVFVAPVIEKMRFVHDLVQAGRAENGALGREPSTAPVAAA